MERPTSYSDRLNHGYPLNRRLREPQSLSGHILCTLKSSDITIFRNFATFVSPGFLPQFHMAIFIRSSVTIKTETKQIHTATLRSFSASVTLGNVTYFPKSYHQKYRVRTLKYMQTHIMSLQTHNLACSSYCFY
jgi:hypothetical protein